MKKLKPKSKENKNENYKKFSGSNLIHFSQIWPPPVKMSTKLESGTQKPQQHLNPLFMSQFRPLWQPFFKYTHPPLFTTNWDRTIVVNSETVNSQEFLQQIEKNGCYVSYLEV